MCVSHLCSVLYQTSPWCFNGQTNQQRSNSKVDQSNWFETREGYSPFPRDSSSYSHTSSTPLFHHHWTRWTDEIKCIPASIIITIKNNESDRQKESRGMPAWVWISCSLPINIRDGGWAEGKKLCNSLPATQQSLGCILAMRLMMMMRFAF